MGLVWFIQRKQSVKFDIMRYIVNKLNIKQLHFINFSLGHNVFCRPEHPILTEALAEVNILNIQICKQTY